MSDTIFALSSGAAPAGIGVVRISGPSALRAGEALSGRLPEARKAALRTLRSGEGEVLDRALVLRFDGPQTATGEDLVELHLHGGRAVVAAVEAELGAMDGLRRAEPGEFTRRALLNGRIDLTEAEGLADLLEAETETARRAAIETSGGSVRRLTEGWTSELVGLSAQVEAELDHGDEEDVATGKGDEVAAQCVLLADTIAAALNVPEVERIRDGVQVVLAGPPNAGKSTLLNRMVEREVAIVSPIAGTTRDRIEAAVQHEGIAFVFSDTAGIADATDDPIETIGIERAREAVASADIVIWMDDADVPGDIFEKGLAVVARCDVAGRPEMPERLRVSGVTGEGVAELWQALGERAKTLTPRLDGPLLNRRQRALLRKAEGALRSASSAVDPLLLAEELRVARHALDRITGRADIEAVLDGVFSRFCIGK
ncbi:MAG: tRNA uridine-5-carboxymethylaminomethyl(34) synthesis GTPase MnmE [Sphingomonas sp.]|nr:tRNA uridine-5-carboxymethylaminomethyl(34) synthesis GTPase MnmE [Sphingomonas sp.]